MNKNILNSVPVEKQKTNVFDLSHDIKTSFNMGYLIPTTVVDTVPGDSFTIGFENMLRFASLLAPIMHRVKVTTHYFFVPNRILWSNWEKWITGELDVEPPYFVPNNLDPQTPRYGVVKGSLCDHMGIPVWEYATGTVPVNPWKINALPFAAYWKIYHEYYMDQNNDPDFDGFAPYWQMSDGNNSTNNVTTVSNYWTQFAFDNSVRIGDRAWMHDYFTSALPWAQKGDDVFIPLTAPVVSPFTNGSSVPRNPLVVRATSNDAIGGATGIGRNGSSHLVTDAGGGIWIDGQIAENTDGDGTIANLRRAFALQSWLEKNARGGTRYTESILVHFGVRSSDQRLQRPEYLGGSVQNMVISEVLSTAQTLNSTNEVVNPVGQMSGHGISVGGSNVLKYYCEEHGWIIGLISVMPDTAYQDGISKKFLKSDRFDYFWPSFQHIGEQEIKNIELWAKPQATQADIFGTFGYVPRYTEYKYENNRVSGDFRETLDFWHLGRKFDLSNTGAKPLLNDQFIYPARYNNTSEEAPFNRIFAVNPSEYADSIYAHVLNKIKARRPMAMYGIPSI